MEFFFGGFERTILTTAFLVALCVKAFAFVTSMTFPAEAYAAAGKLTKPTWALILGIGLALQLLIPSALGIFNLILLIAAFVYLADVRPALQQVTGRR